MRTVQNMRQVQRARLTGKMSHHITDICCSDIVVLDATDVYKHYGRAAESWALGVCE